MIEINRSFHVRKNDVVMVIAGKEKGKSGKILKVIPKKNRAIVEKVNFIRRHTRQTKNTPQGGIVEREAPLHLSNLMLICSKCNKPIRTKKKILEDGKKVRVCKKCGEVLD
jgi:large subunit ribosomal protein L24